MRGNLQYSTQGYLSVMLYLLHKFLYFPFIVSPLAVDVYH